VAGPVKFTRGRGDALAARRIRPDFHRCDLALFLLCQVRMRGLKYLVAWLLGVPFSIIVLWFLANQAGCGL
jgi:hypothetical protein